ncbi:MAG: alpha-hydroxy-acid oxidizing protein [Chloroflexi bacterium]|nr:alpha-hydroxy-acid oxidizing protein [Chloroflexota bacterium]MCI0580875.1 alpha-hydroxy-acid oxidizing protein [Chloroflexota bacterium]MCI0648250.1 alpha-hydroxy-acid oxidizing protein [Chloroflexota bacterium]MCI0725930.1 alpha-hydroxy-acid oxidizing protein [Chloroflexota bacterium]
MEPINLSDYERAAQEKLPPEIYDYYAGGANDEMTVQENRSAYSRIRLQYRVLRDVSRRSLATAVLDHPLSLPILIAPTAFHCLAHPEGELATARAAARAGTIMIASMAATTAVEEVAQASAAIPGAPRPWLQLYILPDRGFTTEMVRRAEAAGCGALVLTVDSPVFGQRERDIRHRFHELPNGLSLANFTAAGGARPPQLEFKADLTWQDVSWLRATTNLPILLKGIVHPADACLALAHGADGVIVSNHGGRQLDTAVATIEVLPEIVDAVAGRLPILVDGGVRRGTDVLKALALGAAAVAIGRPVLWGLAVAGEAGVSSVLELLRRELDLAMALCGCASIEEINRELLRL